MIDILWRFLTTSACFLSKVENSRVKAEISLRELKCPFCIETQFGHCKQVFVGKHWHSSTTHTSEDLA